MKVSTLIGIPALVAAVLAVPALHWTREYRVFEKSIDPALAGWTRVSDAHPLQNMELRLALKESEDIWGHLWQISDPDHQRYGQHVSAISANMMWQSS